MPAEPKDDCAVGKDSYADIQPGKRPSDLYEAPSQIDRERRMAEYRLAALPNVKAPEG